MTLSQDLTCYAWIMMGIIKELVLTIIKELIQMSYP